MKLPAFKKTINVLTFAMTAVLVLNSCYYDIEEELYPNIGQCDTTAVTYANTVVPLMQLQCVSCHNSGLPSGNVVLDTYSGVRASATNGTLFGSINHNTGYSPMPKGGNKMFACDINKIKVWIDSGIPNN